MNRHGRRPRPGEYDPKSEHQNETQNKNRPQIVQVIDVRPSDGTVTGRVSHTGHPVEGVSIPMGGLSVNGSRSSWRRYMPQRGDFGLLGYGPDDREMILGWTSYDDSGSATETGQVPQHRGYAAMALRRDRGVTGFREWFNLKEGEWHDRSAGGAYVYGSAGGQLEIGAGQCSVVIDKPRSERVSKAGLHIRESGKSYERFGDVKRRLLPTDFVDASVTGAGPEWHVVLSGSVPAPPPGDLELPFYELHTGDVRDGAGLPVIGSPTGPARLIELIFDGTPVGTELHGRRVDLLGNTTQSALLEHTIGGARVVLDATLPTAGVALGSSAANQSVVFGVPLVAQLTAINTQLTAVVTGLTALMAVLANPAAMAGLDPPGQGAAGTFAGVLAPVLAGLVAVQTALAAAPGTLFSLKVLTE